jgi:hypothetical protein
MRLSSDLGRRAGFVLVAAVFYALTCAPGAAGQTLGELNQRLNEIEPRVSAGASDPQAASEAISQLDQAESDFAQIAESRGNDREELIATFSRLEQMLNRMYTVYQRQKDACLVTIGNGGSCDYDQPEQLALRALYPLSWLRFEGAGLYSDEPATARRLLSEAIDGFTNSTLAIFTPELVRENLLGRAFSERELGKYDHSEYGKAIADFKRIMADGESRQYRAAEQGLATTYAAMGNLNQAQGLTSRLASNASGPQKHGLEMLHLRELFRAEAAAPDSAKRAELHRQIMDFIRARANDKDSWAISVAAAAQYVPDPVAEFGASNDPLENWLLANVLYYKRRPLEAAKYYWAAARSGQYPKAYKYAADLYYSQGRLDMVEQVADDIARQPGNPDSQWAEYMRFKIPRVQWERGGMRNAQLESAWVAGAQAYLQKYPHGQYAYEPRFRLGEYLQRKHDYVAAARQYEQVAGNPSYNFTARYNAAECYYAALGEKGGLPGANGQMPAQSAGTPASQADRDALRTSAIAALMETIKIAPQAENGAPLSLRKAIQDGHGRAIYMLATLLEAAPNVDYREVAALLQGFEGAYPSMSSHFNQVFEWRIDALDRIRQYAELEREVQGLVAHDTGDPEQNDYIKEIGYDFWKSGQAKLAAGDRTGYLEDAKLTADTYEYFERMVNEGKTPAKNLTGTLSLLGDAYLAMGQSDRAETVFNQVVRADAGSPDANAGLARIAQMRKDYKDALDLWGRVESLAAESDPLFYESKYNMAQIFAEEGNVRSACGKLVETRTEHPNLGSPAMKAQWGELQHKLCPGSTEG